MDSSELRPIMALANEFKEGDQSLGGTRDDDVRREARQALCAVPTSAFATVDLVGDGLSEALHRSLDPELTAEVGGLTVGALRQRLLSEQGMAWVQRYREGLSSEAIAAVVKVMTNDELSAVSRRLFNPVADRATNGGTVIGAPGHFGARIQPNSPGDDEQQILLSILEGLAYGCGDVIIGLNPASDDLDTIVRLERLLEQTIARLALPARYCVLSDIIKQDQARAHTRVDVGFQSLAGTSAALRGMVGLDIDGIVDLAGGFEGLYFETGQGSEVTNGVAQGVDMVTLEARSYGAARAVRKRLAVGGGGVPWMIVNDVAGFIGPEVFRLPGQLLRACLEDVVMAKLHGLTMGLDVCATFHMGIEPHELQALTARIVQQAAPAYLMAVAGNADPMLGYLTTSFREHPRLRALTGRQIGGEMARRLAELGIDSATPGDDIANQVASLSAAYHRAGGDRRGWGELCTQAHKDIAAGQQAGFDLGYGHTRDFAAPPDVERRLEGIYRHARRALYARLDETVIRDASMRNARTRTCAADREDYLAHPAAGERIDPSHHAKVKNLYPNRRPQIQIVVSDGLNANAVNHNLRALLPALRQMMTSAGSRVGEYDLFIDNGRVRAGYHLSTLLEPEVLVHLIGERPGTGIDTLSAYLTYGRDARGALRWTPQLDHACTTAICGIHPRGKSPAVAVEEITVNVMRMLAEGASGVAAQRDRGASDR